LTNNRPHETALLLDFYEPFLTEKQAEILKAHCDEDYSLSEIAENLHISRQAVHGALRSGTTALRELEEKLGLVRAFYDEWHKAEALENALAELRAGLLELRALTSQQGGAVLAKLDALEALADRIGGIHRTDGFPNKLDSIREEERDGIV
jgi:predicted DNA-binding protein YlxM (UPF0122 family)